MPVREYVVRVGERQHRVVVEVDRTGGAVNLTVDGLPHEIVALPQPREFVVRRAEATAQLRVGFDAETTTGRRQRHAWLRGASVPIDVRSAVEAESERARRGQNVSDGTVTAPMPGQVVKLLAAVDDEVQFDQPLLIVEAMKMENELRAPCRGRLLEFMIQPGQAIEAGQVLAKISAAEQPE